LMKPQVIMGAPSRTWAQNQGIKSLLLCQLS
jgi:hypothetical protein